MSLDFYLNSKPKRVTCTCPDCGHKHKKSISEYSFDVNITHNLAQMANKAGIYEAMWRPGEKGWKIAKDIIPTMEKGIAELEKRPAYFKKFNPENGWGSYDNLLRVAYEILGACEEHPDWIIKVSR